MFITLTISLALGLSWLTKKLIQSYPNSPHPRQLEKMTRPITDLAESLVNKIIKRLKKSA